MWTAQAAASALGFLAAASLLLWLPAPQASADDLAESLELLDRLERTRVTLEVREAPIDQVMDELALAAGVQIRTDWAALASLTVDADDRITFAVRDVPADAAIAALLSSLGLPGETPLHDIGSGQVVVTTIDRMSSLRRTDVYDLRPLLGDRAAETMLEAALAERDRLSTAESNDPERGAGNGAPAAPAHGGGAADPPADQPAGDAAAKGTPVAPPPRSRAGRLAALILDHVDPEAWLTAGGLRGRIDELDNSLVVTATPRTHRQVRRVLGQLAALRPATLALELAVVEIDRSVLELARRRHEPGSAALARAILATERITVPWRGGGPTRFGEPLRLESRDGRRRVEATILPQPIDAEGRSALGIDATIVDASGGERRIASTSTIRLRDGAAIVDLGDSGPTATVLVILAAPHG